MVKITGDRTEELYDLDIKSVAVLSHAQPQT